MDELLYRIKHNCPHLPKNPRKRLCLFLQTALKAGIRVSLCPGFEVVHCDGDLIYHYTING